MDKQENNDFYEKMIEKETGIPIGFLDNGDLGICAIIRIELINCLNKHENLLATIKKYSELKDRLNIELEILERATKTANLLSDYFPREYQTSYYDCLFGNPALDKIKGLNKRKMLKE